MQKWRVLNFVCKSRRILGGGCCCCWACLWMLSLLLLLMISCCCCYHSSASDNFLCTTPFHCLKHHQELVIYSQWNDGCIDGGLFYDDDRALLHPNAECPDLSHIRWTFEPSGAIATIHPNFAPLGMCFDCIESAEDCKVIGYACTGGENQRFILRLHSDLHIPNGSKAAATNERRIYFSIRSRLYPTRCLSMFATCLHCLALRCHTIF